MRMLKILTLAGLVGTVSVANATPFAARQQADVSYGGLVEQVHGSHHSCQRGPGGWHRHNQFGERRLCRAWRGRDRRPDFCVRVGPIWYCDY